MAQLHTEFQHSGHVPGLVVGGRSKGRSKFMRKAELARRLGQLQSAVLHGYTAASQPWSPFNACCPNHPIHDPDFCNATAKPVVKPRALHDF
jgi:hypothetical protein